MSRNSVGDVRGVLVDGHAVRGHAVGRLPVGRHQSADIVHRNRVGDLHPGAGVEHHIPAGRLSLDAVYAKFVTSGCARAFQTLRASGAPFQAPTGAEIAAIAARYFRDPGTAPRELAARVEKGLKDGMTAQLDGFENDAEFRKWVLMDNYLDIDRCYTHPDLLAYQYGGAADWRSGRSGK